MIDDSDNDDDVDDDSNNDDDVEDDIDNDDDVDDGTDDDVVAMSATSEKVQRHVTWRIESFAKWMRTKTTAWTPNEPSNIDGNKSYYTIRTKFHELMW